MTALSFGLAVIALAGEPPLGWSHVLSESTPLQVDVTPYTLSPAGLSKLVVDGAWTLDSDHPEFGGFSGLLLVDGELISVSDWGRWFSATPVTENGILQLQKAVLAPMRNEDGATYDAESGDAEGLTTLGSRLVVSFERDQRIMILQDSGRMGARLQSSVFGKIHPNEGLEALATLPDGRLIAIAEEADGPDGIPVIIIDSLGRAEESYLPRDESYEITGADIGPDGCLYVLQRFARRFLGHEFRGLFGRSFRITRYHIGPDGAPLAHTAEILGTFDGLTDVGKLEGIALDRDPDGRLRLWAISDDNFSYWERTLLIRLLVRE